MRKLALLIMLTVCGHLVYGQDIDSGEKSAAKIVVTESRSNEPLQMATVYIVPVGDTLVTSFSFTDKKGTAVLQNFQAGKYVVNVQMLGYESYAQEFTFKPNIFHSIPVSLKDNIEELKGASITEMGDLVTVKGDTLIYSAASFRTSSNANLGDLLKKMPGIEVDNGSVRVNGEPVTRITVEGKTFFFDDQSKALENLPAVIVNQIRVIDKENQDRFGMSKKGKEMDVRLKEEYKEAWFGRLSAEGGVSIKDKSSDRFGDGTRGLYNAKAYAQYFGEDDDLIILGGGNNFNPDRLSRNMAGLSDVASAGVNYGTSRISGYDTDAAVSYDFRRDNNRSERHRTSFLSSGERLETTGSNATTETKHSATADFEIQTPQFEMRSSGGIDVRGSFQYDRTRTVGDSRSSTKNSNGDELNGSKAYTAGNSDDFNASVDVNGEYFLDKGRKHHLSFMGNIGYDGMRGNSEESSITRLRSASEERNLLYTDRTDDFSLTGSVNYRVILPSNWDMYSNISADYSWTEDNREADNVVDRSRNDWYSRYSKEHTIRLKQSVNASYGVELGGRRRFNAGFGLAVYENKLSHYSKAYGVEDNSNTLWQVNAGPDIRVSYKTESVYCNIYTRGRSVSLPDRYVTGTVPDISNPVDISTGNIYLKAGYHQDVNLNVTYGRARGNKTYASIRLAGAVDLNEITRASWYDASAVRYSIPVNSRSPRYNALLNVTYIQPLNKRKSLNLSIVPKINYSTGTMYVAKGPLPGFDMEEFDYGKMMKWFYGDKDGSEFYSGKSGFTENRTRNLNWSLNADLKYEIKEWSLKAGGSVNNSMTNYSAYSEAKVNNWRYNAFAEALWKSRKAGWEVEGRFDFNGYSGFSNGYNRPDWLLNLKIAKEIKSFTISLSAYDILGSSKSFSHIASAEYVEDTFRNNPGRSILIGISYNFGKWSFYRQSKMNAMEVRRNL